MSPLSAIRTNPTLQQPPAVDQGRPKTSYADLYCRDVDREKIAYIITTVEKSGIELIWHKKVHDFGEEILPVHPYKFLSTILLDPILKIALKKIFNEIVPFKKYGFLGGVQKGMEREFARLDEHMGEFAAEMRTTVEKIRPLIQAKDWNGLVCHLIETNS